MTEEQLIQEYSDAVYPKISKALIAETKAMVIEKTCEWLKYNAWSFAHTSDGSPFYDTEMAITTFKQAMEE